MKAMQARAPITATRVPAEGRNDFLMKRIGFAHITWELDIHKHAERFARGYAGDYWEFYDLSNRGLFMAPAHHAEGIHLVVPENGVDQRVSAEAFGLITTIWATARLAAVSHVGAHIDLLDALQAYAIEHAEHHVIKLAIE